MILETMGYSEIREDRDLSIRILEHYDLFLGHYFEVVVTDVTPIQTEEHPYHDMFAMRQQYFENPHHLGIDLFRECFATSEEFPMPPPRT